MECAGPAILAVAGVAALGRVNFALGYTKGNKHRSGGFVLAMVCEQWAAGLVLFCAIKAIAGQVTHFITKL
jgi:hypothetical protein